MDDDRFKKEVLSRLDSIQALLLSERDLPEASLVEPEAEPVIPKPADMGRADMTSESSQFLMRDEMQEGYNIAIQRWKTGKSCR